MQAGAATHAPWSVDSDDAGMIVAPPEQYGAMLVADRLNPEDAAYIATMHPDVARGLADLLTFMLPLFRGLEREPVADTWQWHGVRIARAVLGEDA